MNEENKKKEKQKPILNFDTWKNNTLNRDNQYFNFIKECKSLTYSPGTPLHCHHIIPQYVFNNKRANQADHDFKDSQDNIVFLTLENHLKAHALLFEIYGNRQDQGAITMMRGLSEESLTIWRQLGAYASHKVQKESKKSFWNVEQQKENARKSMSRPDALQTRSKGGKKGGRIKSLDVVISKDQGYLFYFEGFPLICILNCETGGDVLNELNKIKPTNMIRVSPLLTGKRKYAYGWSCQRIK